MENKTYLEKFIEKVKTKHGEKFTFEKTKIDSYKDYKVKTTFTCEIHGDYFVLKYINLFLSKLLSFYYL